MSERPLLIGQAPGPNTDPDLPLFPVPRTSAGGRLVDIMGVERWRYMRMFDRINLLPYFPGRHKRDDKCPISPARLAARTIRPLLAGRAVILVGRNVADAFGIEAGFHEWAKIQARPYEYRRHGLADVAVIPHPSGRNHWYNKQGNRDVARAFWADFFRKHEHEERD